MVLLINKSNSSFVVNEELTIKSGAINEVSSEIADKLVKMYPQSFEVKIIGQSDKSNKVDEKSIPAATEEEKSVEVKKKGRRPKIQIVK